MQNILLGCIECNEKHTSANLVSFLRQIIQDWQITHKITCVVSDNAANILAAVRLGEWRSVGCFAHSLNLVVQDGLKAISDIIVKVKSIVEFFKRSSTAQVKLESTQKQMDMPPLKLKQECQTRWNSCFEMLDRILKIKNAVISTLALIRCDLSLHSTEWEIIEKLVPILQPFYEITQEISAAKYVTLSKVLIFSQLMAKHIARCKSQNPEQSKITDLLNRLQIQIQTRFTDLENNSLYADASILDPRFKQKGFRSVDAFKKAAESLRRRVVEVRLPREEVEGPGDHQDTLPTAEPSNSIWGYFDAEMSKITRPGNPVAAGIRELDKYLNEEYLNRKEDPLQWWHSRRHLYPHVHI